MNAGILFFQQLLCILCCIFRPAILRLWYSGWGDIGRLSFCPVSLWVCVCNNMAHILFSESQEGSPWRWWTQTIHLHPPLRYFLRMGKDTTGEGEIDLITFMGLMSLWRTGHRSFANVSWGEFKDPLYIRNLVWVFHKKFFFGCFRFPQIFIFNWIIWISICI